MICANLNRPLNRDKRHSNVNTPFLDAISNMARYNSVECGYATLAFHLPSDSDENSLLITIDFDISTDA